MATTWTKETIGLGISSDSLTVDNIVINGTTIGHTDDTDLITLANGALTVAGTITSTGTITGTLATAAQANITSVGTLTTLTVDNVIVNGTTIGHTSDTDLMTLASGVLTVKGTVTVGIDGTGHDVKFFGDIAGNYMLWDESDDRLEIRNTYARAGLLLSNTNAGSANSPAISYYRNSASADAGDTLGITTYTGRNGANDADVIYARLQSSILDATKGGEEGQFKIGVMVNGTFRQESFQLAGQSDGTVDALIGYGAASTTTVAGDLAITGGNITNAITFDSTVTVGADTDGHDVKFFGNTTANYMLWDESQDTLKVVGKGIEIKQLGGNDYQPRLNFYNYDANNSSSQGMTNINFYNSKSDSETNAETDADAHLGRLTWYASTDSAFKYAGSIACRQTSAWGSGDYVGNELRFIAHAQIDDGSTVSSAFCWAPPATPAAGNLSNLILGGASSNITQASATQIIIRNGVSPSAHIDNYIHIGSKDSAGTGTDALATLSLFLEEGVDSTPLNAVGTLTTRIPVWVNGTCYWLYLDPV